MSFQPHTPPLLIVNVRLEFPADPDADAPIVVHATGSSPMRRRALWVESNVYGPDEDLRHAPADWIHHVALAVLQDRPNSQERLIFALTGGLGIQETLDF